MRCDFLRPTVVGIALTAALTTAPLVARDQPGQETSEQQKQAHQKPETPIDRWFRMTPEERERELAKLPPERARLIRQQLMRYSEMSSEEKTEFRERYQLLMRLPPALRQLVRQRLEEFRELSPARRTAVHDQVLALRALPVEQRAARLDSDEMQSRFSAQERQIIRDLAEYLDIKK
jgi:hypothetical protein